MTEIPVSWRLRSALARHGIAEAGLAVFSGALVPSEYALWCGFLGGRVEDFLRTARSARSLRGWTRAFSGLARAEEARAERALARGAVQTAADAFARAPVYWHFAHFGVRTRPGSKQPFVVRGAHAYRRGLSLYAPPVEEVRVPYRGVHLPGYLHLPDRLPDAPVPLVVVPNALNHPKEVMHGVGERLARRGVAAVAIDAPGVGESWDLLPFDGDVSDLGTAVRAWASRRGDVDADRLGAFALSLGATMSAQMAVGEPAFRAVALFSPVFDPAAYWRVLPPVLREEIRYMSGRHRPENELALVARAGLVGRAERATAAAFIVDAGRDWIQPPGEGARLASAWGGPVELRDLPELNHGGLERIHALADEGADWLVEMLGAAPRLRTAGAPRPG